MKVQIGSGRAPLPGFLNVDIRPLAETDVVGHAGDLGGLADGSVEVLFSHALFEHVFLRHQLPALREWGRVLAPDGLIVCLGIPDFEAIARLYLGRARGVVGERFDLFNVYRYTHGEPEHAAGDDWAAWKPDRHPDSAPAGWLPQLHKGLYDANYLRRLFEAAGLPAIVFNYAYPGEEHALNLGVVVDRAGCEAGGDPVGPRLGRVPAIGRYVAPGSVAVASPEALPESLLAYGARPSPPAGPRRSLASRAWNRLGRAARPGRR